MGYGFQPVVSVWISRNASGLPFDALPGAGSLISCCSKERQEIKFQAHRYGALFSLLGMLVARRC